MKAIVPLLSLALVGAVAVACTGAEISSVGFAGKSATTPPARVVRTSEVKWEQLNPARGDKSPLAGTLWGDRSGSGPTGFLLRPVDGFRSPPHIHNVAYRGVVIHGLIHNDDPKAEDMWLPSGSFWTQPAGEVHITAAKGTDTLAYIEIEQGPYLVWPVEKTFDSGEKPINVDASNIVWIDPPRTLASADGAKVAFLWGSPQPDRLNGTLIKLPAGFTGTIRPHGSDFRAVVIQGRPKHRVLGETGITTLDPGSYFSSAAAGHYIACEPLDECIIYVRMKGKYDIIPTQP